jgi:PadR family transcriptional regulator, regulatory protein PadR
MSRYDYLGNFELMVLLAVLRVGDNAYGVLISRQLEEQSGQEITVASVYAALQRMEEKGLVTSWLGDPTPERGGRAKRFFKVTAKGLREIRSTQRALQNLWAGVPQLERGKA